LLSVDWAREGTALRAAPRIQIAVDCLNANNVMCPDISYSC
jgi:hypothetical protein